LFRYDAAMKPGGSASGTLPASEEAETAGGWRTTAVEPDNKGDADPANRAVQRARRAAGKARSAAAAQARLDGMALDFFAQPVRDQVSRCVGRPVSLLRAGCQTPVAELGLHRLRDSGYEINVQTIDVEDQRLSDMARGEDSGAVVLGDLRTIPLPPRSFDIVHCSLLLDRISHVPLVLDRFTAALRPGGLLLLRIRDRDCAAGWLDRKLPGIVRAALWRQFHPGEPGPFRAVYEPTGSARGITAYLLNRGLVVSQRRATRNLPHQPERLCRSLATLRKLVAVCSRGRLTDSHDQVLLVIRKPEDRFARVVLAGPYVLGRRTRT
jgi:SAM-dependent methyltransferase